MGYNNPMKIEYKGYVPREFCPAGGKKRPWDRVSLMGFTQHYFFCNKKNSAGFTLAGFTLIELLVVIAIIGVLSSIVLSSLINARNRSDNASIKSNLNQLQRQAQVFYETTGNATYGSIGASVGGTSICGAGTGTLVSLFADTKINAMINAAFSASSNNTNIRCGATPGSNPSSYAVSVPLKSDPTYTYWCVDSNGISKGHTVALTTTTCP